MNRLPNLKRVLTALSAVFLSLLLTSCGLLTETHSQIATEFLLPPAGLIVPCRKPAVIGTWPEVITEDIPKLKAALSKCAAQTDEYLKWRNQKEEPG